MTIQAEQKPLDGFLGAVSSKHIISIQCVNYGNHWQATAGAGWYSAVAATKNAAVSNLIRRIERETDWTQEK